MTLTITVIIFKSFYCMVLEIMYKICFVDHRLTVPEAQREREGYRRRDRTQVSKIALPSAFDVRAFL